MLAVQFSGSFVTLFVVCIFLFLTLILGLYAGRNIKDFKDYALGDKNFTTISLVLTFLATYIGGGATVGAVSDIYNLGIIVTLSYFGLMVQHLIFAFIIAPKITQFKNCYTIGDLMFQLYGRNAQILTGVVTFFFSLFSIAVQFYIIGKLCNSFLGVKISYGIIVGGTILGIYSALGGIKAVAMTDILQFVILIIVIPIIAALVLNNVGGYKELFMKLPKEKFLIFEHKKFYRYLTFFLLASILPNMLTSPAIMQRIFMVKNEKQLRNKFLIAAAFDPIFRTTITIIALCALVLYPNIDNSKNIFPYIFNDMISSNILKGIAISGLLAVIMSTADSFIHSGGIVFYNDFLKPIFYKRKLANDLSIVKIATIFISILSIFLAIKIDQGWSYRNVSAFKYTVIIPILLFPIFVGIMGLKTDRRSLVSGIIGSMCYLVMSKYFLPPLIHSVSVPIATLVNGLFFIIAHLIQNKGFSYLKRNEIDEYGQPKEKIMIPKFKDILLFFINKFPTPKKILHASRETVLKYGANNMSFGIFCCINFVLPYMMWRHETKQTFELITNLRLVGGIMAALLIVRKQWNEKLKPYFPIFWHLTLIYCLPFLTTLMFLITNGSLEWLLNISVSLFFLILLVEGPVFLVLAPLGVVLGILFHKVFVGPIIMSKIEFTTKFLLSYQLIFGTAIALIFAYRKKFYYAIKGNQGLNLGLSMGHELKNTGLNILPYSELVELHINKSKPIILDGIVGYFIDEKNYKHINENNNYIKKLSQQMLKIVKSFEKLMIEYKYSLSNPKVCSIKSLVEEAIKEYNFAPGQRQKLHLDLSQDFRVKVPKRVFIFVIDNLIRNAFKHGEPSKIKIWIDNNELHVQDNGKGIPRNKLFQIFQIFYSTGEKTNTGIGLAFAKQIIESINGEMWCDSEVGTNSYTEFTIRFPAILVDVEEEEIRESIKLEVKRKNTVEIASRMLKKGITIDDIISITDLSKEDLEDYNKKK